MSWDDDSYEFEFVKFDKATQSDAVLYEDAEVLYCKIEWDTIEDYTNMWNKAAKKVRIQKYSSFRYEDGFKWELLNIDFILSIGSRLYRELRKFHSEHPKNKNIKILRIGKRFDTTYHVSTFKPTNQEKVS